MRGSPPSTAAPPAGLPLVETKLVPARARPGSLLRGRLLAELDRLSSAALTLVVAPVGFGKSVLAQSWCGHTDSAVAWVSLERGDDDPVRLWTYIATSVDRVRPGLGRTRARAVGHSRGQARARGRRAGQRHQRVRTTARDRARRPARDRRRRMPGLAGARDRPPPAARPADRNDALRPSAPAGTATRPRDARRAPRSRARVHARRGAGAASDTRASRSRETRSSSSSSEPRAGPRASTWRRSGCATSRTRRHTSATSTATTGTSSTT